MKSPLGFAKLRKLGLTNKDKREPQPPLSLSHFDELALAAQDMQQMRDCYDSLLSAAAATANSAYEFSESLQELGTCLLEKTGLPDNEASDRLLLMLGEVQFELQKLVDNYRAHVLLTITNPSESLLNELRTVEEMKRQCDEKRTACEHMMAQQKDKGKSKGGKGESFTFQQLKTAHDEYDEQATLCVFRLKSLKQGQSRSLLTQAARHHAAQLNFFRKGLKSLDTVDQQVRLVTEQQHIDYQISGLDDEEDNDNSYDVNEEGELSFDYRPRGQRPDIFASRNSMEVDQVGSFPPTSTAEHSEVNIEKDNDLHSFSREHRVSSHSAPIFAEKKSDPAEKARQIHPSSTKTSSTYVLPTPIDVKGSVASRTSTSDPHTGPTSVAVRNHNLWHSSPLEQKKHGKDSGDDYLSGPAVTKPQSVFSESRYSNSSTPLPPPLVEGSLHLHQDTSSVSDMKKVKRQAFSGPIANKPSSAKPITSANGLTSSSEPSQHVPGIVSGVPGSSSSPKVSPSASPPVASPPRISELHELPRPPGNLAAKSAKSASLVGHSAPLVLRNQEFSGTNKITSAAPTTASPLPTPPMIVPRSFSIPSSSQRAMAIHVSKLLEVPQVQGKMDEVASPPLTPLALSNIKPLATVSEISSDSGQIKGGR